MCGWSFLHVELEVKRLGQDLDNQNAGLLSRFYAASSLRLVRPPLTSLSRSPLSPFIIYTDSTARLFPVPAHSHGNSD
jgi:hypothetical protein